MNYPHVFWMLFYLIKWQNFQSDFKLLFSSWLSFIIRKLKNHTYLMLLIPLSLHLDASCVAASLFLLSIPKRLAAGSHLLLLSESVRQRKKEWDIFGWTLSGGSGKFYQVPQGQLVANWNYLRASWLNNPIVFAEHWLAVYAF